VKQPQNSAPATLPATGVPAALPLDAVRLEQFLDLQRSLLEPGADPRTVPDRIAQGVALFLPVAGAAVGLLQDGQYRLLAERGLRPDDRARCEARVGRDDPLLQALTAGHPVRLADFTDGRGVLLFPFRGTQATGGLHLLLAPGGTLTDEELQLARVIAVLAGSALSTLRQCRRLARVARLKSDALTAMTHDLRAPLNALVGYASLLGEGAFGPLTGEQTEVAGTLRRQALELVDLLNATLDVARLETGHLPVRAEPVSLPALLETLAAGTFAHATHAGRLRVALATDLPLLTSDRVKVKEIVQNLIDNALKHAGDAPVDVQVALAPDRETVRITVRDAGPGIAPDLLPRLFEPFRPAGETAGTGFGLYLVRSFAEALGGRVAARSLPGEGTAMTVELPLSVPAR
jgi:signal transduction histidine kinase